MLLLSKRNKHLCCHMLMWYQHLKLFTGRPEINIFELMCLMKLTFCCFLTEINILAVTHERDTVSFTTALTWTLLSQLWEEFTSTWNQSYASSTSQNPLQSSQCFTQFSIITEKNCFWVCFCSSYDIILSYLVKNSIDHISKRTWREDVGNVKALGRRNHLRCLGCLWLTAMPQFSCLFGTQCTSACGLSTWYPDCIQFFP